MPVYEYKCTHCGHVFDELRNVEDRDKLGSPCPKCACFTQRQVATAVLPVVEYGRYFGMRE